MALVSASEFSWRHGLCFAAFSGCGSALLSDSGNRGVDGTAELWNRMGESGISTGGKKYGTLYPGLPSASYRSWSVSVGTAQQIKRDTIYKVALFVPFSYAGGDCGADLENVIFQTGIFKCRTDGTWAPVRRCSNRWLRP